MSPDIKVREGTSFALSGNLEEALKMYQEALRLDPYYSPAIWSRSFIQLLQGNYKAWADYSWLSNPKMSNPTLGWFKRRFEEPLWKGQKGVRLFLYIDNGYGDFIQFIRYASLIKDCKVIVEVPPGMEELAKTCKGVDEIATENTKFDMHCPLMLLPRYFGILDGKIFAETPYLKARETALSQLILSSRNIGVAWKGNPKHKSDVFRSIEPSWLEVLQKDGLTIYSLQKGEFHSKFCNLGFVIRDWVETASIVDKMDLIITVDTSIAHLAGAIGKNVWVLIPEMPDWRWLLDKEDTPWYPTMRLWRKKESWRGTIEKMKDEL